MKPSDDRVRRKKDKLQQARNARGKVWQDDLLESLCGIPGAWARQWPADWAGQPYDIEATIEGRSRGIECKHIAKGNLPFSAFRPNEVENLSRKEDAGGIAVVAVRRDSPAVAFMAIRQFGAVTSGEPMGSSEIQTEQFAVPPRISGP